MFGLAYGFWQQCFQRIESRILIVGLDQAGKTSVLERLKAIFTGIDPLPPGKILPTVGLNIGRMKVNRQQLVFWDLGGASNLRSLWEKYYSDAHALLYIVDASDPLRMDESRDVLRQLLNTPDLSGIPVLVFANKQDKPGAVTPHEVQARFGLQTGDGLQVGSRQPMNVLGATSLSGDGVEEGVIWLVDVLRSHPRVAPGMALVSEDSGSEWMGMRDAPTPV